MSEVVLKIIVDPISVSVPLYRFVGVPPGGTIRQALLKRSGADFDIYWGDVESGGGGGSDTVIMLAGETLSALKFVYEDDGAVFALSNTDEEDMIDRLLGVTITAAGSGTDITVRQRGYIEDSGWSWTLGRIYLGLNGSLTQVPPAAGASLMVGSAVSPTKVLLNIQEAIFI